MTKTTICLIALTAILIASTQTLSPSDEVFNQWLSFSKSKGAERMISWLRCGISRELLGEGCHFRFPSVTPAFYGRFGIFITLMKGKRTRGCYGAMDHKSDNLETVLTEYLRGALRSDERQRPVDVSEIDMIKIIVTIADRQFSVSDINVLDISRYGVIIMDDRGNMRLFVPAEIRSIEQLKGIIKKLGMAQVYAFRAVTIRHMTSVRSAGMR